MVKRNLPICFLFLAGIILVGHAIIPHHHHLKVCEFVNEVISHTHGHDCLKPFAHSHQHDGSSAKHCVLDQTVVIRSGSLRIESQATSLSSFHGDPASRLLFSALLNNDQYHYIPEFGVFRRTDHPKPSIFFLSRDQQFRGPPAA